MEKWDSVSDILEKQLEGWFKMGVALLPNLVIALIVVFGFVLAASVVQRVFTNLLNRVSHNVTVNSLLSTVVYLVMIAIGIFVALGILQLDKTVTSLLAGAGVIGIALGFAFQEIASNFIAGVFIAFMKPFKVGDIVEVESFFGSIYRIDIRTTSIMTFDQLEVAIPNKDMFTKTIKNYTTTPKRRLDIKCGVSYGDDLRKVIRVAKESLEQVVHRTSDDEVAIHLTEFGDSSINFVAYIWIEYPGSGNFLAAQTDAIIKLKEAFDREDIMIPFPIRTLDFGIKGGVPLNKQFAPSNDQSGNPSS